MRPSATPLTEGTSLHEKLWHQLTGSTRGEAGHASATLLLAAFAPDLNQCGDSPSHASKTSECGREWKIGTIVNRIPASTFEGSTASCVSNRATHVPGW